MHVMGYIESSEMVIKSLTLLAVFVSNVRFLQVRHGCDATCWGPGPGGCLQTLLHRAIDENNESTACFLIRRSERPTCPFVPSYCGQPSSHFIRLQSWQARQALAGLTSPAKAVGAHCPVKPAG